ncbi:MAG: methyltransferase domain-containing protein [Gemmatimonadaceae bacterium]|nr:methyltransferase domain-containing protein [Gemmatimonadaceae bacterium]
MASLLAPPRRRGTEILDDPSVSPELMTRSMSDVARSNALLGGTRAAMAELNPVFPAMGVEGSLLDVGTGWGDIAATARSVAGRLGVRLWTVGLDTSERLVTERRASNSVVTRGDALRLPFRDRSVDVVLCSQILHHFEAADAQALVREMNRVARRRAIIADLRRSRIAMSGLWLASFALGFHPVSRHDGMVSVMRGFLPDELADIVQGATGQRPTVKRRLGFRLTASWTPQT